MNLSWWGRRMALGILISAFPLWSATKLMVTVIEQRSGSPVLGVQALAETFVAQLQPKDQMAVVAYHSSADLIQDFTASRQIIMRSLASVKYGNQPHVLDALF